MLRSMFTAISSLSLHQSFLDVVSDNLANTNTPGFKSSRVLFQDQFAQTMNSSSSPTGEFGGTNPVQIGLGVQLGYIAPVFTQGMLEGTGRNLDLAVQGDGFLIYNTTNGLRYSREGSLQIDSSGYIVNGATGFRVQGWQLENASNETIDTNQPIGDISIPLELTLARATSNVTFGGNMDSTTAVGADAYVTTVGVYDSLGEMHDLQIEFTRTGDSTWDWNVTTAGATGTTSGTITFDANGHASAASTYANIQIPSSAGGTNPISMTLDMTGVTMLANPNSVSVTTQDGLAAGSVSDIFIAPTTAEVYLLYSNGLKELRGQIAVAKFTNPTGLMRDGHSMYQTGLNSGEPQIGAANEGGRGALVSGYKEASNVDLAQEFTNMILAQRGFQASSRVITTSDEMMLELVNLKR